MGLEHTRLVRQVQMRLNGWRSDGDDDAALALAIRELHDRVRRLHRLGGAFSAVRVSRHVVGLRAVSVPDRSAGVSSPGIG
ncbi:MAG: hypothetical protein ACYSUQ_00810 [Planctomycetota bacterium]|jgi:hypothetical protein